MQVCRNIPVNLSLIEPRADMWKAGLSVVAKLNMARYSNRQRERIQNPSSVDSNSTRATSYFIRVPVLPTIDKTRAR